MRFHTCVKETGGYFEHSLWHFNLSVTQKYSCLCNVKYPIIINYQSLNYGVKLGCVLLFTNIYKYDVMITSSAAINLYTVRIYHSLGIFTAIFV